MDRHADHIVPTVGQPFAGSRHQEVSVWRGRRLGECDVLPSCQPLRLHFNAHRALPNKETKNAQTRDVRSRADKERCLSAAAFSGALTTMWKESRERPEQQVTLLLLDIDNLHQLNTVHGRDAGDRAINAATVELSRTAKREGWTLGRIGGDEFALIAPGMTVEAAFLRADGLRRD